MPELPEVESIRKQLEKYLTGHRIKEVEIRYGKKFEGNSKDIIGGKIIRIRRFGKAQSIDLDNGYSILIHIKLTGQLIYKGPKLKGAGKLSEKVKDGLEGKHTHIIFHLDREGKLYYNDVRKFGWIKIVKDKDVESQSFVKKLGPEPLKDLSQKKFKEVVKSTKRNIKTLLMDQTKIAGVGNIYANDALWLAGIKPERESNKLGDEDIKKLFNAVESVLKEGLKRGGANELSFVTPDGKEGNYQDFTKIYGREGEKCKRCGSTFKKMKISGRGTYFCPGCQK
jgi:formamidopyrimidine-DNA glycosylase